MTQHDHEQNKPADRQGRVVPWVQYNAPLFVRVQPDEDGWVSQITKVILVVTPEHIPLAPDVTGGFLVYDENFEPTSTTSTRTPGSTGYAARYPSPMIDTAGHASSSSRWPTTGQSGRTCATTPTTT